MVENIEGIIQITVLIFCVILSLYRMFKFKSRKWALVSFFFGSYLTGDLYWEVCLLYFGQTPDITLVCDLSWYAALLFLFIMLREELESAGFESVREHLDGKIGVKDLIPLAGPVFTAVMALFYMRFGAIISNVIYAVIMGIIFYSVIWTALNINGGLSLRGEHKNIAHLCMAILMTCLGEYGAWTASCFFDSVSITNPYIWFNVLVSMSFPAYLVMFDKEVGA